MTDQASTDAAITPNASVPRQAEALGRIETRGIDVIPDAERRGKPSDLFAVWFTGNLTFTYLLFGGILVQLGLSLTTAVVLAVVCNLAWIMVGLMATAGPKTGTTTMVVSRAQYGFRGNQLSCFFNLVICLAYEGLNIAIATFAAVSLADFAGVTMNGWAKAAVVLAVGAVVFTLGLYGHATIVAYQKFMAWALGGSTILFVAFVIPHVDWSYRPETPLGGSALMAAVLVGISIVVSGPLSYPIAADYSRYLPRSTSPKAVALFTALGGYLPTILLTFAGILAATVVDASDFTSSIRGVVPGWFYPIYLLIIIFGVVSNCIYSVYSSGLAMQSMGVPLKRTHTVWIDGGIGTGLALLGVLLTSNFLEAVENGLLWSIYWLAPFFGIYLVELFISRANYDSHALHDRAGPYWYKGGFRTSGVVALLLGMICAAMVSNTPYFTGPISTYALADGDLSAVVGLLVGGLSYWLLTGSRRKADAT
jgi:nucleobase:cation symporter-1, NCS1 family